jgi:Skp family chaperone for outer membrane proteins
MLNLFLFLSLLGDFREQLAYTSRKDGIEYGERHSVLGNLWEVNVGCRECHYLGIRKANGIMTIQKVRRISQQVVVAMGAASILLLATQAPAQTPTLPQNQAEYEKMIGLTADQKKRMEAIGKRYEPKFQAIQKKYQPQFEALQKQMQALQQKAMKEVEPLQQNLKKELDGVLTATQRKKVQEIENAARKQQGGG